jgi:hypothetical protein
MKLLKIISILFIFYFIRRFIQLYRVMKTIQANQNAKESAPQAKSDDSIDADFRVIKN